MNKLAKRTIIMLVVMLLALAATPTFAQDDVPEPGDVLQVNTPTTLNIRVLPAVNAPKSAVPFFENGAVIQVEAVSVDGNDIWVEHQFGWSAYRYGGQVNFVPADATALTEFQAQELGQGGGGTFPVFYQRPLYFQDQVIGFATTPEVSPAVISVPEGGFAIFAKEVNPGMWVINTYEGQPNDNSPVDLNYTEEVDFSSNALWFFVFDENQDRLANAQAMAQEILDEGLGTMVTIDNAAYAAGTATFNLDLIQEADFSALGQGGGGAFGFVPYGANQFENGWQFIAPTSETVLLPLDGRFSFVAMGPGTVTIDNWSVDLTANREVDGNTEYGVVMNLVLFVEADTANANVEISNHVAGNVSFVTLTGGDETEAQSLVANVINGFSAPNCGRGCQQVNISVITIDETGPLVTTVAYTVPELITEEEMNSLLERALAAIFG